MAEYLYLQETALALHDQFGLGESYELDLNSEREKYDALKKLLAKRIQEMIDHEFDKFINLLYRIDISEPKVKEALAIQPFSEALDRVAEMIIERQLQKVITRKQYSTSTSHDLEFDV